MNETKLLCTGASGFIGTNFVDALLAQGINFLNIDKQEPKKDGHRKYWQECNILNLEQLKDIFQQFQPTLVVHFAARTDTDGNTLNEYIDNTDGTANVLEAIKSTKSVLRVIIVSTQFVHKPGHIPENDEDFEPHTVYGQSKVICEKLTRSANLDIVWTIIRPTNVWGPWHPRYPYEFWTILKKGLYFHPGGQRVMRCYGYVGNVVYQILQILAASPETVNKKVYYVGDSPINLLDWTNGFSKAITGKNVRIVPKGVVRIMAFVGDCLSKIGIKFPITTSRFKSMTTDYLTPMSSTMEVFGEPPYSLDEGIHETVQWLTQKGLFE